ncbi:TPA: hypothetical protein ACGVR3_002874 [Enterococcus faecium]
MESTDVINEIRGILPRNSIGKYDLLTIFTHKTVFDKIVKVLSLDFQNKVDYVAAPEAIGWILGTAIAKELGVGFIGVRKGEKVISCHTQKKRLFRHILPTIQVKIKALKYLRVLL